ncbi:Rdx family-domain-containing protein [Podospora appendiculata]|uniref:Rdx family-domain-containing protein n=1 Tax=Podospora appendiculata TaxID=314037 RepID=A0AAE1CFN6_9PEZI|nr:Rdx family-domain-containing protein [Podospora appendiculata]
MAENPQPAGSSSSLAGAFPLPRVAIRFCTQCKWLLRAAYYAQELLSTFSTSLGEVALQPATGGVFIVEIVHAYPPDSQHQQQQQRVSTLWDRKTDGGFPETKELKRRVRDVIQPGRDLGHVDRDYSGSGKGKADASSADIAPPPAPAETTAQQDKPAAACGLFAVKTGETHEKCEDCD